MLTESASAIGTRLRMQTQIIVSRRAMKAGHGHESWQTSQLITTVHNPFCLQIVTECQVIFIGQQVKNNRNAIERCTWSSPKS